MITSQIEYAPHSNSQKIANEIWFFLFFTQQQKKLLFLIFFSLRIFVCIINICISELKRCVNSVPTNFICRALNRTWSRKNFLIKHFRMLWNIQCSRMRLSNRKPRKSSTKKKCDTSQKRILEKKQIFQWNKEWEHFESVWMWRFARSLSLFYYVSANRKPFSFRFSSRFSKLSVSKSVLNRTFRIKGHPAEEKRFGHLINNNSEKFSYLHSFSLFIIIIICKNRKEAEAKGVRARANRMLQ